MAGARRGVPRGIRARRGEGAAAGCGAQQRAAQSFFTAKKIGEKKPPRGKPSWNAQRGSRLYSLLRCTRAWRPRPGEAPPKDIPSDSLERVVVALGFGVSPQPYTSDRSGTASITAQFIARQPKHGAEHPAVRESCFENIPPVGMFADSARGTLPRRIGSADTAQHPQKAGNHTSEAQLVCANRCLSRGSAAAANCPARSRAIGSAGSAAQYPRSRQGSGWLPSN